MTGLLVFVVVLVLAAFVVYRVVRSSASRERQATPPIMIG